MDTKKITGSVRTVYFVAFPGAEILDITGPMETFAFANLMLQQHGLITEPAAYQIEVLAEKPGPLLTSCGLRIIADRAYSEVTDGIDTLFIAGAPDVNAILCDPMLADWVRTVSPCVRRLASVCTGAFLLAESGVLDGRRATSHWGFCKRLAQDYPSVRVEPDHIFIRDGEISTSGGVTSGIDLALALVDEDWGRKISPGRRTISGGLRQTARRAVPVQRVYPDGGEPPSRSTGPASMDHGASYGRPAG